MRDTTSDVSDLAPPRDTYSILSVRYDVNQARVEVVHSVKCCGEVEKDEK